MSSKALLIATATLLAFSAVSCGQNDNAEDSVSISLSDEVTATKGTSAATPDTTESASDSAVTETSTTTTEVSGTESTTTTVQTSTVKADTDIETAETTTTVAAETSKAEETTQSEQEEQPTENNTPTEEPPAETQAPETPTPTEAPEQPSQSETVKFKMEDLLSDASGIIAGLGTPSYTGGGAACLTNGHDDKIYQYDGLEIQCYIDGDTEYIFQINITGGDYQTDKGIKIGSTRAEVESAYGTGTESGNIIVYSSGNNEMDIQYNGDTVASIFFYTPV